MLPRIPTASMADIAFLLIIFFMLTTSFSPERTSVRLPQSAIRTQVSKDAAIIAATAQGNLSFSDGEQLAFPLASIDELGPLTKTILELIPRKEFVIKADRAVRYRIIDDILEKLRNNGARNIGLLTVRRSGEERK